MHYILHNLSLLVGPILDGCNYFKKILLGAANPSTFNRLFIAFTFVLSCSVSNATVYSTTADGSYSNCAIWFPACPPITILAGDTVIISHNITMSGNIDAQGTLIIDPVGTLTGSDNIKVGTTGAFYNNGDWTTSGRVLVEGSVFNSGTMTLFDVHNDGYLCNSGLLTLK